MRVRFSYAILPSLQSSSVGVGPRVLQLSKAGGYATGFIPLLFEKPLSPGRTPHAV